MAYGKTNIGAGGGNGGLGGLNVYAQDFEPFQKEGIWLKTTLAHNKVQVDTNPWLANSWILPSSGIYADAPVNFRNHTTSRIGNKLYVIGGSNTQTSVYTYNLDTHTWAVETTLPISLLGHAAVVVGTDIYLVKGRNLIKYSTASKIFTTLATTIYDFSGPDAVVIDNKIYVANGSYFNVYDINSNTWSILANTPFAATNNSLVNIGNKIYYIYGKRLAVYDIASNTWTQLTPNPITTDLSIRVKVVVVGDSLYMFGGLYTAGTGDNLPTNVFSVYNTTTDTWLQMPVMPTSMDEHSATLVGDKIILIGSYLTKDNTSNKKIYAFSLNAKVYDQGTFVVQRNDNLNGLYYTEFASPQVRMEGELHTRTISGFNNAWLYSGGDLLELPAYYGDGTQWIKFKN